MKVICTKPELSKSIALAISAVSTKNTMPILANLLLTAKKDILSITGTDLEIGMQCQCPVEVLEEGSITIPAKKLMDIVREFSENEIEMQVSEQNKIAINCGKSHFKIMGISPEDFPSLPTGKKDKSVTIKDSVLLKMLKKCHFSVSVDETRYVLNGVLLETDEKNIRMISTDGHRLSYTQEEISSSASSFKAIIPSKAVAEMMKILSGDDEDITINFTDNHLFLEKKNLILTSRLIDGQFPNYDQVIPKITDNKFVVRTKALAEATRRVAVMAADKANSVRINIQDTRLNIQANTPDVGEAQEEVEIEYSGKEMTVAYNARFIQDVLKVIDTEQVEFCITSPLSPSLILPKGQETTSKYVVMPMRT
jgi:DNA polymerase III subunit beta